MLLYNKKRVDSYDNFTDCGLKDTVCFGAYHGTRWGVKLEGITARVRAVTVRGGFLVGLG